MFRNFELPFVGRVDLAQLAQQAQRHQQQAPPPPPPPQPRATYRPGATGASYMREVDLVGGSSLVGRMAKALSPVSVKVNPAAMVAMVQGATSDRSVPMSVGVNRASLWQRTLVEHNTLIGEVCANASAQFPTTACSAMADRLGLAATRVNALSGLSDSDAWMVERALAGMSAVDPTGMASGAQMMATGFREGSTIKVVSGTGQVACSAAMVANPGSAVMFTGMRSAFAMLPDAVG